MAEAKAKSDFIVFATDLFMKYGIRSVTMDDIARRFGISKKTVYQYVENKEDLLTKIVDSHIVEEKRSINAITKQSVNAIDEMVKIGRHINQQLREVSPTTLYDLQKYYRSIWNKMEKLEHEFIFEVIKKNLTRGIKEGLYRENIGVEIIAKLYVGKTSLIVDEDMFPLKENNREQLFTEFITYHIYGIASKKGIKIFEKYSKI